MRLVCVALALGSCVYASTGTALARREKPVISVFTVAPKRVPSEGTVSLTQEAYDEAGAVECTLSSSPALADLPEKVPCRFAGEEGNEPFEFPVEMPANTGKKAVRYKLTLIARGAGGKAEAKATVTVEPGSAHEIATEITSGGPQTCALLYTDHVECWGYNEHGELGDGTSTGPETCPYFGAEIACSRKPVEATSIGNAGQVGAVGYTTCAVLSTGHVDCWGANYDGELGNGTTTSSDTPVEVSGISDATEVAGGRFHTCALLSTDHVECWGANWTGQLGDGTFKGPETCPYSEESEVGCSRKPVEVTGITNAIQVAASEYDTCALLSTRHVECWGWNRFGQLGNDTSGPEACGEWLGCSTKPVEAKGITDARQVGAGGYHTCAVLSTGHVECWGENGSGQLGDGTATGPETCEPEKYVCSRIPVEVTDITNATQVAPGFYHTCALLSTGRVFCWGANGSGQLGNGITTSSDTPVEVAVIANVTQAAAGGDNSCALESTGRVYCWGENDFGQLGDGTTTNSDEPVEVAGV